MQKIIDAQRAYFESNITKEVLFRIAQLNTLENVVKQYEESMYQAIYSDFKKSEFETYASEVALIFTEIKEAKKHIYKWSRKQKVATNLPNLPASSYIIKEPLGVCLVIGAWNYPFLLSLSPAIAAIAAGNTVVLKPSEIPSETSTVIAKMINENFDTAFFHVVEGGVPETTELLQQKFDKIFFTGSTKVGKIVYEAAAKNLTPVTLELGGKSPAIVTKDCNLKMSVKRLVWGKFLNAGQTCIAPDYVVVDKEVEVDFLKLVKAEIEQAKYAFEHDNYVQIINKQNFERLVKLISKDNIYVGGTIDAEMRYISPTVLQNVRFEDAVMKEEIFGPILPVISFTNLDAILADIKKLPKPLSCYVFTSKRKTKKKILTELSFGGGAINDTLMHLTNPNMPFGGVGNSGIGAYHGKQGFDCFSHHKSILDKPTWFELPLKFSPYSKRKLSWLKRLL